MPFPNASLPVCPVVTATPAQTSVTMEWAPDANATLGYRIFFYSDAGGTTVMQSWTQYGYNPVNPNSITKNGLTANTQYWYRVSPINPDGSQDTFGNPAVLSCGIHTVTTLT